MRKTAGSDISAGISIDQVRQIRGGQGEGNLRTGRDGTPRPAYQVGPLLGRFIALPAGRGPVVVEYPSAGEIDSQLVVYPDSHHGGWEERFDRDYLERIVYLGGLGEGVDDDRAVADRVDTCLHTNAARAGATRASGAARRGHDRRRRIAIPAARPTTPARARRKSHRHPLSPYPVRKGEMSPAPVSRIGWTAPGEMTTGAALPPPSTTTGAMSDWWRTIRRCSATGSRSAGRSSKPCTS